MRTEEFLWRKMLIIPLIDVGDQTALFGCLEGGAIAARVGHFSEISRSNLNKLTKQAANVFGLTTL